MIRLQGPRRSHPSKATRAVRLRAVSGIKCIRACVTQSLLARSGHSALEFAAAHIGEPAIIAAGPELEPPQSCRHRNLRCQLGRGKV